MPKGVITTTLFKNTHLLFITSSQVECNAHEWVTLPIAVELAVTLFDWLSKVTSLAFYD